MPSFSYLASTPADISDGIVNGLLLILMTQCRRFSLGTLKTRLLGPADSLWLSMDPLENSSFFLPEMDFAGVFEILLPFTACLISIDPCEAATVIFGIMVVSGLFKGVFRALSSGTTFVENIWTVEMARYSMMTLGDVLVGILGLSNQQLSPMTRTHHP